MPPALRPPPAAAALLLALFAATPGASAAEPKNVAAAPATALPAGVVQGVPTTGHPSVGLLTYRRMECTATLIGCRTALTAAHCLCYDWSIDPPRLLPGDECRQHSELSDPTTKRLFFQHAGSFGVEEIVLHPGWVPSGPDDLAILRLDRPVTGVRPAEINDRYPVPPGSAAVVVGFGRTRRDQADQGLKRAGAVSTSSCAGDFLCWWLLADAAPGASGAGLCYHDSGGPLFADLPAEGGVDRVLAGVSLSTSSASCLPPARSRATDVHSRRDWIAEVAGADLGAPPDGEGCGGVPAAGGPGSRVDGATGRLSARQPDWSFFVQVPEGTGVLRATLTATGTSDPADADFDLYLRRGRIPRPDAEPVACASEGPSGIEACEVRSPEPGAWYALVRRVRGEGRFQLVATQLDGEPPLDDPADPEEPDEPGGGAGGSQEPPPDELAWLAAPGLPGFEAKVRIGGAPGAAEAGCIPETLCLSGALAGRPEVFVKVVGPRPNGHFWAQVARFTPARVEIWLRRVATGAINHYVLDPVGPGAPGVPGLQDRQAFPG